MKAIAHQSGRLAAALCKAADILWQSGVGRGGGIIDAEPSCTGPETR